MPQSTVASQPALQWVSTRTGRPVRSCTSWISPAPCAPIAWFCATSSSAISPASSYATRWRSAKAVLRSRVSMRSVAQRRLTAVGRVAFSCPAACSIASVAESARTASAMP